MKFKTWIKKWNLSYLKINAKYLEIELKFSDVDKKAAWDMYVELLTRSTTQNIDFEYGDEQAALQSFFSIFNVTREILKKYGSGCIEFSKIAIIILNQVIRPFTTKWHRLSIDGAFSDDSKRKLFRQELVAIQTKIKDYTKCLSDIAGVEDLSSLDS